MSGSVRMDPVIILDNRPETWIEEGEMIRELDNHSCGQSFASHHA